MARARESNHLPTLQSQWHRRVYGPLEQTRLIMTGDFFDKVFRVVRLIPEGRVTTYGHIARFLGTGRSARIVGYAMNASHNDRTVPAHRVVNRVGLLTGKHFFDGTTLMRDLLESEGIVVLEDKIQEFSSKVWDPMEHLDQDSFFESSTP